LASCWLRHSLPAPFRWLPGGRTSGGCKPCSAVCNTSAVPRLRQLSHSSRFSYRPPSNPQAQSPTLSTKLDAHPAVDPSLLLLSACLQPARAAPGAPKGAPPGAQTPTWRFARLAQRRIRGSRISCQIKMLSALLTGRLQPRAQQHAGAASDATHLTHRLPMTRQNWASVGSSTGNCRANRSSGSPSRISISARFEVNHLKRNMA
jgi:hypothetical protein